MQRSYGVDNQYMGARAMESDSQLYGCKPITEGFINVLFILTRYCST